MQNQLCVYLETVRMIILPMYYLTMHGNKQLHKQTNSNLLYLMRQKNKRIHSYISVYI